MSYQVIGDLFNRIFAIQQSDADLYVESKVWNRINMALPKDYQLPDQMIMSAMTEEHKP